MIKLTDILKEISTKSLTVDQVIKQYMNDTEYDIENSLGNCAFFAKDMVNWGKKNGIEIDYVYMPQDESYREKNDIKDNDWEDHVAPIYNNIIIDFALTPKGVSKKVRIKNTIPPIKNTYNPSLFTPKGIYGKWGYLKPEINTQYGENKSVNTLTTVPPNKK